MLLRYDEMNPFSIFSMNDYVTGKSIETVRGKRKLTIS